MFIFLISCYFVLVKLAPKFQEIMSKPAARLRSIAKTTRLCLSKPPAIPKSQQFSLSAVRLVIAVFELSTVYHEFCQKTSLAKQYLTGTTFHPHSDYLSTAYVALLCFPYASPSFWSISIPWLRVWPCRLRLGHSENISHDLLYLWGWTERAYLRAPATPITAQDIVQLVPTQNFRFAWNIKSATAPQKRPRDCWGSCMLWGSSIFGIFRRAWCRLWWLGIWLPAMHCQLFPFREKGWGKKGVDRERYESKKRNQCVPFPMPWCLHDSVALQLGPWRWGDEQLFRPGRGERGRFGGCGLGTWSGGWRTALFCDYCIVLLIEIAVGPSKKVDDCWNYSSGDFDGDLSLRMRIDTMMRIVLCWFDTFFLVKSRKTSIYILSSSSQPYLRTQSHSVLVAKVTPHRILM